MSTRAQIGFYESEEKDLSKWEALIYRHSDGYPDTSTGVLAEILPFLQWWSEGRGLDDSEYCSARLLQYLCNKYDERGDEFEVRLNPDVVVTEKRKFTGILGHGICNGFYGDIEYFYAIYPDRLEVYDTLKEGNWRLLKTINLATNGT